MKVRISRIVVAAIAIEALGVLFLVLLVALFGPADASAAQAYAERLGYWVGPIAGFVLCLIGGWWVAKGLPAAHVAHGLILGLVVAAIDIALLLGAGAEYQPIFALANIGRIVGGCIGGLIAAQTVSPAA